MEDKHTLGPWTVEKAHASGYHACFTKFVYWIKGRDDYICFTQFDHPSDENVRTEEVLKANAELIAQAPDLLRENRELKEKINVLTETCIILKASLVEEVKEDKDETT